MKKVIFFAPIPILCSSEFSSNISGTFKLLFSGKQTKVRTTDLRFGQTASFVRVPLVRSQYTPRLLNFLHSALVEMPIQVWRRRTTRMSSWTRTRASRQTRARLSFLFRFFRVDPELQELDDELELDDEFEDDVGERNFRDFFYLVCHPPSVYLSLPCSFFICSAASSGTTCFMTWLDLFSERNSPPEERSKQLKLNVN